ncbi:MAG: CPBP family intramembrane metalloprotease [Clostridia bacterium]|nr:CPBP family intramembrane metalloprotease [Clostridia bacterium]
MLREKYNTNDLGISFAVVTIMYLVVNLIMSVILQIFHIDQHNVAFNIIFNVLATLAIGGSAFVYSAISRSKVVTVTKMNVKPPLAHIGWGCLATLFLITCMLPLNNWIADCIEAMGLPRPSVDIEMNVVWMIIVAGILPAFCEEIIFRGTIAQTLQGNRNKLASLAIVGGLFAVFHMNPAQTVHQFVLGAFLALLVYRSGSLWTSVIIHFFNNIVVIILSATLGESIDIFFQQNAIWLFFVGLIGFVGCVCGYMFTTKSKWQTDEEQSKISGASLAMLLIAVGVCLFVWIVNLVVPASDGEQVAALAQALVR